MSIADRQANVQPKDIAEAQLGAIKWEDETKGYCTCPGEHLHSSKSGDRECAVYLDGVATIFCFHDSCEDVVHQANQALREAIDAGEPVDPEKKVSSRELQARRRAKQRINQLEGRSRCSLKKILKDHHWPYDQIMKDSKDAPAVEVPAQWKQIVGLFKPEDVIWIGDKFDSGKSEHAHNFKPAEEWLNTGTVVGQLTCPAVFKSSSISRSNDNVLHRRFLVVESDVLTKDEVGAVFKWLKDEVGLNLRAVVDTAGKSLHGWFDYPKKPVLDQLEIILPQLGCDKGLFRASQPCRIPGALRDGKYQRLVFLDASAKARSAKIPSHALPLPDLYYDGKGQSYWRQNDHAGWQKINDTSMDTELMAQGFDGVEKDMAGLTEVKQAKRSIQLAQDILFAGPLAGYFTGLYTIQGQRVLVTSSPNIIKPCVGGWPTLQKVIDGLLIDGDIDQRPYFYGWMKRGYESLATGKYTPGQALCLAGPKDCGKSLLQSIITEILGGRSAKPYESMTGDTTFNEDLFAGEHLMIEDDVASTDIRARRKLGAAIKRVTVNTTQRCHPKGRTAIMLTPFWRLSIAVNDEPENLLILPPLDDSLLDKMMIFKTSMAEMPIPTADPADRVKFWERLMSELPAFIHVLENWEVPEALRSQRFGVVAFQHPAISEALMEVQPETRLLSIIDQVIFNRNLAREASPAPNMVYPTPQPWAGSAEDLEAQLTEKDGKFSREAQKLLYYSSACGTYLGRLHKAHPERVGSRKLHGKTLWDITPVLL